MYENWYGRLIDARHPGLSNSSFMTGQCHNEPESQGRLLALLQDHCKLDVDFSSTLANHIQLCYRSDHKDPLSGSLQGDVDGAVLCRIRKRVELLGTCGVEPGNGLQKLLKSTEYDFLHADLPVLDANLEILSREFSKVEARLLLEKMPLVFGASVLSGWSLKWCRSELRKFAEQAKQDEMVKSLLRAVDEAAQLEPVEAPAGIMSFFGHQRQALAWMLQDVPGGILGT
ncbi:hypothetical protein AAVH_28658 [Aphelenchoides avenae]|nr:hypothetical protein AAVH_28658 [Aphelenchus avenae]